MYCNKEKAKGSLLSNEQLAVANIYTRSGNIDKAIKILNDALISSALKPDNSVLGNTGYEVDALKISTMSGSMLPVKGNSKNMKKPRKNNSGKDAFYRLTLRSIAELQTKFEVQKSHCGQTKPDNKKLLAFRISHICSHATLIIGWLLKLRRKQNIKCNWPYRKKKNGRPIHY
jgi:hypothetical protein